MSVMDAAALYCTAETKQVPTTYFCCFFPIQCGPQDNHHLEVGCGP